VCADSRELRLMTEALGRRRPDDEGYSTGPDTGGALGPNRLAGVYRSLEGRQPSTTSQPRAVN